VVASVAVVVALSSSGGVAAFSQIVLFSGVTVGVPYFFSVMVQLYYLYTEGRRLDPRTFPREAVLAIVALVFSFWMIAGSDQLAIYLAFLIFLIGFFVMLYLYIRTGRFGVTHLNETGEPSGGTTTPRESSRG
jgi:APA family basic amino acid/polyamine antiporter